MFARPTTMNFSAALRDIRSDKPKIRVAAADILGDAKDEEERTAAFSALAEATGDPRPEVRTTACLALASLGRHDAWEILALCLSDDNPETRQAAAIALGTLGAKNSFPALAEALRDGPDDLRFQAASSMVEVDAARSYAPLLDALESTSDAEVLGAIALALGAVGNADCADKIAEFLDHSASQTRLDAAYALSQFGDARASDTLAAALAGKEGGWDAVCALEELGASSVEKLRVFLGTKSGEVQVRLRAAGALLTLSPQPSKLAQSTLLSGLHERKFEMRALALQLLSSQAGEWAIAALTEFRKSRRSKALRDEVDEALTAIFTR